MSAPASATAPVGAAPPRDWPGRAGWTGGQYSLFRGLLGAWLAVHFARLVPWGAELYSDAGSLPRAGDSPLVGLFPNVLALIDGPFVVTGLLLVATGASLALAAGWRDRICALGLWYLWACLGARNPLADHGGLHFVGLLLLLHAAMPRAPFGSLEARGRFDPGGGWRPDRDLFRVAWMLMAIGYTYGGLARFGSPEWSEGTALARLLESPLARPGLLGELVLALPRGLLASATWAALGLAVLFAPLALFRAARPWLWTTFVGLHVLLVFVVHPSDLNVGMVLLHLFTFDPAWVSPRHEPEPSLVFYDGHCGLCHRTVRLLLAEDTSGEHFRFAPLQGPLLARTLDERQRAELPDSIVVRTPDGTVLVRSDAVAHMLIRLGGLWRVLGEVLVRLPRFVRDPAYDAVARVRKEIFGEPEETCPLLPPELTGRFVG